MASFEGERSGTGALRERGVRRSREGDLARLARSMERAFAVGSLGFWGGGDVSCVVWS